MKPDAYMPFYGDKFFQATKGLPRHISFGYLLAIWHYWSHNQCQGLLNDSESLRMICEIDESKWAQAEKIIFDNDKFFTLGPDGKWHQKKAAEEWVKAKSRYDSAVKAGKNRWQGVSKAEHSKITRAGIKQRWKQA